MKSLTTSDTQYTGFNPSTWQGTRYLPNLYFWFPNVLYYPQKLTIIKYYWFRTVITLRSWEKATLNLEKPSVPPFSEGGCRDLSKSEMVLSHQHSIALLQRLRQQALQKVLVTHSKKLRYRTDPSPWPEQSRDDGRAPAQSHCYTLSTTLTDLIPCYGCSSDQRCWQGAEIPALTHSFCADREVSKQGLWKAVPVLFHTHTCCNSKRQWRQQRGKTKPAAPALNPKPPILSAHTLLGRARGCFWLSQRSGLLVSTGQSTQEQLAGESMPSARGGRPRGLGAAEPGDSVWANLYVLSR